MKTSHSNWLLENNACGVGMVWIKHNNVQSLEEVWNTCERGDWLLWMAEHLGVDERKLAICAALSAHTVVQYMEDPRSREAVRVIFLWARGKATDAEVDSAWHKASAAFYAAEWDTVWAARTALSAIGGADNDNIRSHAAASAAAASWVIGEIGGNIAANQLRTAEIARKLLTEEVMRKIKEVK